MSSAQTSFWKSTKALACLSPLALRIAEDAAGGRRRIVDLIGSRRRRGEARRPRRCRARRRAFVDDVGKRKCPVAGAGGALRLRRLRREERSARASSNTSLPRDCEIQMRPRASSRPTSAARRRRSIRRRLSLCDADRAHPLLAPRPDELDARARFRGRRGAPRRARRPRNFARRSTMRCDLRRPPQQDRARRDRRCRARSATTTRSPTLTP